MGETRMSANNSEPAKPAEAAAPTNPFLAFWANYFEQSGTQTQALLENMQNLSPQQVQKRWLDAMSQSLDSFMRSPAFLEGMQRQMKAITDFKAFQDQITQDVARQLNIPLASDIIGLFERLHSIENTVVARLKAIESRLAAIESRLNVTDGHSS
jgi:sulfite reductase alpha subunit-like flavoprotein